MMSPIDTDLMKHPAQSHIAPTAHERQALRAHRKARRDAFFAFAEQVFAQALRHPNAVPERAAPHLDQRPT